MGRLERAAERLRGRVWLLSSAVVLLCARDERVMMLEPPYALLGAEPPERARIRAAAADPMALRLYGLLDRVWPGFFDRNSDLSGPIQSAHVLMGHVAECAAERLKVRETAELEELWHEFETVAKQGPWELTPLYDRMCWRAQYQRFDLEFFRAQLGPTMKAALESFERQRGEEEERAIREGSQGY